MKRSIKSILATLVVSLSLVAPVLTGPLVFSLLTIISVGLSACSSTQTMAGRGSDSTSAQMFPLTEEQADKLLATVMTSEFAGSPISRVEFPNKGYQTTVQFILDSHTIIAYRVAAKGVTPSGKRVSGYYFTVSSGGTMPISQGSRASRVYQRLKAEASALAPPLPVAR
jgi:hypothetical protein